MEQIKTGSIKIEQMDKYFNWDDKKDQAVSNINMTLLQMPKHLLLDTCRRFGLNPVYRYLNIDRLKTEKTDWDIKGFIRYMDTYLIELSGGQRQKLITMGEAVIGQKPASFSPRLIRLEIISSLLTKILKQSI